MDDEEINGVAGDEPMDSIDEYSCEGEEAEEGGLDDEEINGVADDEPMDFIDDYKSEDEEAEEDDCDLGFEEGTNPLELVEGASGGVELYKQFELLEYEALAESKRKRKAEEGQPSRGPRKKAKIGNTECRLDEPTTDEIDDLMFGYRKRSRRIRGRGRRKGARIIITPAISRKLGDATLHYAAGDYDQAIPLLQEIVRVAPNCADAYYMLGLIYDAQGNRRLAMGFHMILAFLTPKDACLWKKLITWSIEEKNIGQARYCLLKAIAADPHDVGLRLDRALLYSELGEHLKSAESYEQILTIYPANVEARIMAAKMYQISNQVDKATAILEDYLNAKHFDADVRAVHSLIDLEIKRGNYDKARVHIEHVKLVDASEGGMQRALDLKSAICLVHLGNVEEAGDLLKGLQQGEAVGYENLITQVADAFANKGFLDHAIKYYHIADNAASSSNGNLLLKTAECYLSMAERGKAVQFFYKALSLVEDKIDARLSLSALLLEDGKDSEAINLLSNPKGSLQIIEPDSSQPRPWWLNGKIKLRLAKIYQVKGMLEEFIDTIYSPVKETLEFIIQKRQKMHRKKKRVSKSVLVERTKVLNDSQEDNLFGFRPFVKSSELTKAARARRLLQKREVLKKEKKEAALAACLDWNSDSEDETIKIVLEPPLLGFLQDEEDYQLIFDLCKALAHLREYLKALKLINVSLRSINSTDRKEELRALCACMAYNVKDPDDAYDVARYIVLKEPYSLAAWNCYYRIVVGFEGHFKRHFKFMNRMLASHGDCIFPIIINGHHFTMLKQHQTAANEYLKAYKIQPENPLVVLCVGCALINLAMSFRLENKHQCVIQGFAFLSDYLNICHNSQEALFNVARAYHQVGLYTLAAQCYEKVLSIQEKNHPIPKFPYEDSSVSEDQAADHCNLHREAAYNLHLIYKKNGATDLARKVLKDYCRP